MFWMISFEDLKDKNCVPIQAWFRSKAEMGFDLLFDHCENMHKGKFNWKVQLALALAYEFRAQRFFSKLL